MNAISRALKKGDANAAMQQPSPATVPTSPKRTRGQSALDTHEQTAIAKQYLSAQEGGDINLGMLDQEAFARAIASGQQQTETFAVVPRNVEEEEEEEGTEMVVDDVIYRPSGVGPTDGADPIWSLRLTCLPILDILSTELLKILSSHQHSTILQIVTGTPASPLSHNYITLLHLFDATKRRLYSEETYQAFLDPDILGFKDMQERKVIRKANLATFISSVFGSVDVGFFHLNEGFLATMAPDGGRLLKDMARLFLDLKTQAYISAMGQPSRDQNSILSDLFPSTAQLSLLFVTRRMMDTQPQTTAPTPEDLTPAEVEFVTKCERRREHLRQLGDSEEQVQALKETYSWESFLRELRAYIAKNWEIIVGSRGGKPRRPKKRSSAAATVGLVDDGTNAASLMPPASQQQQPQGTSTALPVSSSTSQPIWEAYEKARMANQPSVANIGPAGSNLGSATGIPPPQTPLGKSADHTLRVSTEGSQVRRPWTKEEENALFAGLERVQGPNWAAILQLYGPGGSVSEALKDRSQVQLKDKARNLKLFFLKGGHEVPAVLERVTGRLKGTGAEDSPSGRKSKKRRTGEVATEGIAMDTSAEQQQPEYTDAGWQPTEAQSQDFEMVGVVGENVDPGLQMPHGN